ncbi:MAG TPA: integrase [Methanoculleus sp.]|nr:integrase [Methanoculleus sp.]
MDSLAAPTIHDRDFHIAKPIYAERSVRRALKEDRLTQDDVDLFYEFITELQASQGISDIRKNKLVYFFVSWRRFLPPYRENGIAQIYQGISAIKSATNLRGRPFKQNTINDHIILIKRFYLWMIENGYSDIPEKKLQKIRAPGVDTKTKSAEQILSPSEIEALIRACMSSRDRALISVLYESGCRIGELARLTWNRVRFDAYGAVLIIDDTKCATERYVRLVMALPYLATWRNDYPYDPKGEALVFITRQHRPLQYGTVSQLLLDLSERAGLDKHITAHIFRHSRITHLISQGMNESVIKLMMWGNINTNMFATYAHLTGSDIDNEVLGQYGIVQQKKQDTTCLEPIQCTGCHTINTPNSRFCSLCGRSFSEDAETLIEDLTRDVQDNPELVQKLLNVLIDERRRQER